MAEFRASDVHRALADLADHLPGVSVQPARNLGAEWLIDTDTDTVWVDDATPGIWAARAMAGLQALARHHGLARPRHLWLAGGEPDTPTPES